VYGRGQQPGLGIGPPITPPIIKQLMIANALIYIAQQAMPDLSYYGSVIPAGFWQLGYLWQPFSYMWLHASLGHIAMNMFSLWMFGSPVCLAWGPKRFLRYYLVCGIGAGLIIASYPYLIMAWDPSGLTAATLGASGAVFGVLLAYSLTWPDRTIMLIFPPVAFRAIWLIPGLLFMTMAFGGGRNISHIGHLGGVIVGWIYMRRQGQTGSLFSIRQLKHRWKRYRMRQKLRSVHYEEFENRRQNQDDDPRKYH
jgi:membrane associated rhomboid family serine protease